MKEIQLTQGKCAIVDDEDFERINRFKWFAYKIVTPHKLNWAAKRRVGDKIINMGCEVLSCSGWVDHINRNSLDNRKCNLRPCTPSQNSANRDYSKKPSKKSRFRGVFPRGNNFRAFIKINGKTKCLGSYASDVDAAMAYDSAAHLHFGEFALLNFTQP